MKVRKTCAQPLLTGLVLGRIHARFLPSHGLETRPSRNPATPFLQTLSTPLGDAPTASVPWKKNRKALRLEEYPARRATRLLSLPSLRDPKLRNAERISVMVSFFWKLELSACRCKGLPSMGGFTSNQKKTHLGCDNTKESEGPRFRGRPKTKQPCFGTEA